MGDETLPRIFEVLLWCAALATWLMLLFAFMGDGFRSLSKSIQRRLEEARRPKARKVKR
jgi:hypothetical protein